MLSLIVAGEAVFSLPFHITRYFRPTFLEVFGFTNTDLGAAMATYGVVGMLAYFPGGPLADKYSPRKLLVFSLLLTALGGLYMATIPGVTGMSILWGFWGVTSILLLWAAMIRATREWGGEEEQGKAFGILDGGRGVFAVIMAMAGAQIFQMLMPAEIDGATLGEKTVALKKVIYAYTSATFGAAVLVWFAVPEGPQKETPEASKASLWVHVPSVLKLPSIWLQSLIVIAAYVAYKASDNYGLYAQAAYGFNEVDAAWLSSFSAWIRPIAAVGAGWFADRFKSSTIISGGFLLLIASFASMAIAPSDTPLTAILVAEVIATSVAVYSLRGIYFALFEESKVPGIMTGTAVGVVSIIGYTPDIFVGLISGYFLDEFPGVEGHQYFYAFVAASGVIGLISSLIFSRIIKTSEAP